MELVVITPMCHQQDTTTNSNVDVLAPTSCPMFLQDSPEFDLVFDNSVDQWVATSSAEKCIFVQILYHACQVYWEGKAGSLGKTKKLSKGDQQTKESQNAPGPSDSPPGPATRTLQARRKSYAAYRPTEFVNCQSKLTGGTLI